MNKQQTQLIDELAGHTLAAVAMLAAIWLGAALVTLW
jgi:hypothetical protein